MLEPCLNCRVKKLDLWLVSSFYSIRAFMENSRIFVKKFFRQKLWLGCGLAVVKLWFG